MEGPVELSASDEEILDEDTNHSGEDFKIHFGHRQKRAQRDIGGHL